MIFMASVTLAGFGQKTDLNSAYNAAALEQVGVESWQVPEPLNGLTASEKALGTLSRIALIPCGINWISATTSLVGYSFVGTAAAYMSERPSNFVDRVAPLVEYYSASTIILAGATALAIGSEYYRRRERKELGMNGLPANRGSILDVELLPRGVFERGSRTRKAVEYLGLATMCGLLGWAAIDWAVSLYQAGQVQASLESSADVHAHTFKYYSDQMISKVKYAALVGLGSLVVEHLPGPRRVQRSDFFARHAPKTTKMYQLTEGN